MAKRFVTDVPGVPRAPSPVSNAVVVGDTCDISGQLAVYDDGYGAGTACQKASRAFDLILLIAKESGFTREDIVYVDLAFANLDELPDVNALFGEIFDPRPARTVYQAVRLPFGAKVKVQAIAMRG